MTLPPGTRLGPYEIVSQLGAGGMGEVYRAADTRLSRHVALKVIAPQWSSDRQIRLRFEREARAISALSHPHVCTLHDIGEQDDLEYLVMEYVEGETIADRLLRGPLAVDELLRYAMEMADALETAHACGIVHRDLKPGNVMITPRGVKILDFGLAKLEERPASDDDVTDVATRPGVAIGTVRYMSPEQMSGDSVGSPSDIFSFGVLLYEAITGRHPFEADRRAAMLQAILTTEPLRPSLLRPDAPAALDDVLLGMMAREPELRPTAADLRGTLLHVSVVQPAVQDRPSRHLVGRESEQAELLAALGRETGAIISITGEAGLGKTTLVEKCLAILAVPNGAAVATGRCSERLAGSEAYLPFLEALGDLTRKDSALAQSLKLLAPAWFRLVSTLPDSAPDATPVAAASQERLKRELATFFDAISRNRPVVLFLDDVHWADNSTIDMIAYLATQLAARRLFIIATARQSELLLQKHPFLQLTRDLQSRGRLHQIALQFLTWEDIQRYMLLEFPSNRFSEGFQRMVFEKTEGSPLFMVDLLRYLRDEGVLTQRDGVWEATHAVTDIEREIPMSVRSMIERKIDQLNDVERRILVTASVEGAEFDSAIVAKSLDGDAAETEEALARLDRVHEFIHALGEEEHPDGTPTVRYRFVHVLYQNSLYGSLGPARKTALSGKVAKALLDASLDKTAAIALQLAVLFETARDFSLAADFFLQAAQQARRLFANQEVILLVERGLLAAGRLETNARVIRVSRFNELLGEVLTLIGRHEDAQRAFAEALEATTEDALASARILRKSANVFVVQRIYLKAAASFARGEEALESMPSESMDRWREWIEIQLDRAWMFYWKADVGALEQLAQKVEPHLGPHATAVQRARFFQALTMAGFRRDRYAISPETLAVAREALAASYAAGDPSLIMMNEFMVGFSLQWRNELEEAERLLQSSLQKSERAGDVVLQSRCLTYLGIVARKRRDDALLKQFVEQTLEVAEAAGMAEYIAVAKANLAWLAWRQKEFEGTVRLGSEALEINKSLPMTGPNWWACCFPMIDALLNLDRPREAAEVAKLLTAPNQHALTEALMKSLQRAVQLAAEAREDDAQQELHISCRLAQESLFL
jgi:tetratricopeptide (TPR) repeat protein